MRKSRLSDYKQDRLIEHFISGSTALTAASLCGVNRKTAAFFFLRLREIIALELEAESEAMFGGEIEVDESYFGGKRKGKRGRGAAGKIPVFGLLKEVAWVLVWSMALPNSLVGAVRQMRTRLRVA
jgi:transposase